MRIRLACALGAATLAAALGLSGCSSDQPAAESASTPETTTSRAAAPVPDGLPAPEALTDVLARLADPAVPGNQKLGLVEGATPADADRLDRFAKALQDSGYTPPTFEASDLAWSDANPSDVLATITANKPQPDGGFSIPMEFRPYRGGWQLSRETYDLLLNFDAGQTTAPPG